MRCGGGNAHGLQWYHMVSLKLLLVGQEMEGGCSGVYHLRQYVSAWADAADAGMAFYTIAIWINPTIISGPDGYAI